MDRPRPAIPDPGDPRADGYYKQLARARLHALGINSPEAFKAQYGVDIYMLTAFAILYILDPMQGERELLLNRLYRAGLPKYRHVNQAPHRDGDAT